MIRLVEGDRLDSIKPLVKWTGGKTKELSIIHDNLPTNYNRMIDPFMGGGSVLLSFDCPTVGNDACEDLIYLYKCSMDESFISELKKVTDSWTMACDPFHNELVQAVNQFKNGDVSDSEILTGKMSSMRLLESKKNYQYTDEQIISNMQCAVRSDYYMKIRASYNVKRLGSVWNYARAAEFFMLRELCYSSMFRFNSKNEFNIPYGGISYNTRDLTGKVQDWIAAGGRKKIINSKLYCLDFEDFLKEVNPKEDDFIFVDPPYDSEFSKYDNRDFQAGDHKRLARCLSSVTAKVQIVISDTEFVRKTYCVPGWNVLEYDKKYQHDIKSRNKSKGANHLLITNY